MSATAAVSLNPAESGTALQEAWPRTSWASARTVETSGWGPGVTVIRETREDRHEQIELVLWRHLFFGPDGTLDDDSGSDVLLRWHGDATRSRDIEEFTVREADLEMLIAALQKVRELFHSGDPGEPE